MQIKIITVGKIRNRYFAAIVEDYLKRLDYYAKTKLVFVKDMKLSAGRADSEILKNESERIKEKIDARDYLIALDRRGTCFTSKSFAEFINTHVSSGINSITFIIGGPLGLDKEILTLADFSLSFSEMTFPHELSLVLLTEQLYRAFTILRGGKYHK